MSTNVKRLCCEEVVKSGLCCGCGACAAACKVGALAMKEDGDGFFVPHVDDAICIQCGRCENVCPIKNISTSGSAAMPEDEPSFYAARLRDDTELGAVSYGGAFWALAQTAMARGGVVYGAAMVAVGKVRHLRAETIDAAAAFRRSKYLPSDAQNAYNEVRQDLEARRLVLFSGTPCQVAALNSFLGRGYPNLVTCEVVCHGIPSAKAWRKYISETQDACGKKILNVVFRDKSNGWKHTSYRIVYDDGTSDIVPIAKHPFHAAYLRGLMNRLSCGACRYASLPRVADITLADFWKYEGSRFNGKNRGGISLVAVNSKAGLELFLDAKKFLVTEDTTMEKAVASCRHLTRAPLENPARCDFLRDIDTNGFLKSSAKYAKPAASPAPRIMRLWRKIKALIRYHMDREIMAAMREYYAAIGEKAPFAPPGRKIRENALRILAMRDAFLLLAKKGVPVFFVNRVGKVKDPNWRYSMSAERRMALGASFPVMHRDPARFEADLRELFGEKYSPSYVNEIGNIPQIVDLGGIKRHEDSSGQLVNVVGGLRVTCGQPERYTRTLHVYGRCGVFGYAVEDADTLPSRIQALLSDFGHGDIRVVNHGLWGGDDNALDGNFLREAAGIAPGDIVLFYRKHLDPRVMEWWTKCGVRYLDITRRWHEAPEAKWCFYDRPGHMNSTGYKIAAKIIVDELSSCRFAASQVDDGTLANLRTPWLKRYLKTHGSRDFDAEVAHYVKSVVELGGPLRCGERAGAIVMNCNPFTLGHRRLVELAAKEVDRLYILVVEEDRSVFPFDERFEMVKAGTSDLPNVVVAPSGRFVISSLTFPEYFMKDYVREKSFDVSGDVRTFCEKIAPALGIKVRFAGEEPFDPVTAEYNRTMSRLLPEYGLEFREIPRFALSGGRVISATEVRRLLKSGCLENLSEYLPKTTLDILNKNADSHTI